MGSVEVDVDRPLPLAEVHIDRCAVGRDAGAGGGDVERAETLRGRGDRGLHVCFLADVANYTDRTATEFDDLGRDSFGCARRDVQQANRAPVPVKGERCRTTDP
jgi:hypothetical protein